MFPRKHQEGFSEEDRARRDQQFAASWLLQSELNGWDGRTLCDIQDLQDLKDQLKEAKTQIQDIWRYLYAFVKA